MSDYIPELSSLAESRALELIATALPALDEKLALPSPEYPAVDGAPATELPALLGQLIRRGLQRPLVEALLGMLQGRALEQTLISWDVLARAEIADWEGDYIAALRANAERARDALPASGEVGVRADVSCDGIVAQLAPPETKRATVDDLLAAVGVHELAAYRELSVRSRSAVDELRTAGVLAQLRQYARLLSLAHLPTLATFYLRSAE